jgi:hypothetical protein
MNRVVHFAGLGIAVMLPWTVAGGHAAWAQNPAPPSSTAQPRTGASVPPGGGFGMGRQAVDVKAAAAPHTMAPYFVPAATLGPKPPDADGFLQRWLILEPIAKPNRTNTVFTDSYVRKTLTAEYFPGQFTSVPHRGETVKAGDQELTWHAVDATRFDVKLFNFAYGLNKQTYGVIFWAVTIVDSPREMTGIRVAAGSNGASMWWLNGEDAVDLFNDRRMVMDDVVSAPLTLKKGKNVLRVAVINGPGLSDFCVRFVDNIGAPVIDLTTSLE